MAAPLDTMFGNGAAAAFAERVNLATLFPKTTTEITEHTTKFGGVYVEVFWRTSAKALIGNYRLEYNPPNVHCGLLQVEPGFRNKGVLTALCKALEALWVSWHLTENTAYAVPGSNAAKSLELCGFHTLPSGWGIELPAIKLREYIAWVNEGKPEATEPAWRKELARPTEEAF